MPEADAPTRTHNLIIRNGSIYDGSGGEPYVADVAIDGDAIATMGDVSGARAGTEIEATGMAVAPGFINMLSHAYFSILQDPRSLSDLKQGVTTEIFGEGNSMGPLSPEMRRRMIENQAGEDVVVDVAWTTLADYLAHAEKQGVSQNVASYIGATTLRIYGVGQDDRPATAAELDTMQGLVRDEMSAGALGIGSSLIYPPAFFASTEELIALCAAAAPYRGKYISHMRDEGHALLEAIDELLQISREGGVPAEIYHLKQAGKRHWHKLDAVIEKVEGARAAGQRITADMYTYTAGATGLSNSIPPRFHDGGPRKLFERLADPSTRSEIRAAIEAPGEDWENLYDSAGGASGVLILGTRKEENRQYQGKTMAEVAEIQGKDPIDALMDLVLSDRSRIDAAYFSISEDNLRRQLTLPWVSFGSDSPSVAAEGAFLKRSQHPRAYGTFARLLGRYARDEGILPLAEAVRRASRLPADNLELDRRGRLEPGYFADVAIFDPATIIDTATFAEPHQYAVGMRDVIVNGVPVLRDGEHTGAVPGRALYGPGRR